MDDTELLRRLKMFFDGHIMSVVEVVHETGLPKETAVEVYEAIKTLRSREF